MSTKKFQVKNILVPTDFSKTSLLAVDYAAFMASLSKANLYLLHSLEFPDTAYNIYNPITVIQNNEELEKGAVKSLKDFAEKLKKKYSITVKTICSKGKASGAIVKEVTDNKIDIVVMGTHGAHGFNEYFMGSNAHQTVMICPCPVITVQTPSKKLGFTNIVLPIDDNLHSRQKVDYAINLAKIYSAKINILGLRDSKDKSDIKKFNIKLDSVQKAIDKAGLASDCKIVKGKNLAVSAMAYSEKVKADLIVVLSDHESDMSGMFLGMFAKQIVNHSKIPVMSVKPVEADSDVSILSGASSN
jgi:nucleotide-binding universal stress UspA family protein